MNNIDQHLMALQQHYQNRVIAFNGDDHINEDNDEDEFQKRSIFEELINTKGEVALITLTRININEFHTIFEACQLVFENTGQGRKHVLAPKDMLLITLTYLASGSKFSLIGQIFNIKESLVYRTIHFTIHRIARPLVAKFCVMPIQLTPEELHFQNFPNAVGAIDTTFILINKPDSKEEQKRNWSFKHGMCGVKIQARSSKRSLYTFFCRDPWLSS